MADPLITPHRIQRLRTKGWRMPPNTIYVGRPTCWGNHYAFEQRTRYLQARVVRAFRKDVEDALALNEVPYWVSEKWACKDADEPITDPRDWLGPLRGRNLACWCPLTWPDGTPCPCHADVLLEAANA